MKNSMTTRNMVFTALFAAIICVMAPFAIPVPFSPAPITLATFAIYIAASSLNWKYGTLAVLLYLLIGLVGLPVFAKGNSGFQALVGPTGGYLIGYIPCALIIGFLVDKLEKRIWIFPVSMILGTIVLYAIGTAWYATRFHVAYFAALIGCATYLPGDAVKIILATVIAPVLRKTLKRQRG